MVTHKNLKFGVLKLEDGHCIKVWLKAIEFPMQLTKKIFINENGSKGIFYISCLIIYGPKWRKPMYDLSKKVKIELYYNHKTSSIHKAKYISCLRNIKQRYHY